MSGFRLMLDTDGAKSTISGHYVNRMRRRMLLQETRIVADHNEPAVNGKIIEGDSRSIRDLMAAFAELAWADGWRPVGLEGAVVERIRNFRPAPPDPNSPTRR